MVMLHLLVSLYWSMAMQSAFRSVHAVMPWLFSRGVNWDVLRRERGFVIKKKLCTKHRFQRWWCLSCVLRCNFGAVIVTPVPWPFTLDVSRLIAVVKNIVIIVHENKMHSKILFTHKRWMTWWWRMPMKILGENNCQTRTLNVAASHVRSCDCLCEFLVWSNTALNVLRWCTLVAHKFTSETFAFATTQLFVRATFCRSCATESKRRGADKPLRLRDVHTDATMPHRLRRVASQHHTTERLLRRAVATLLRCFPPLHPCCQYCICRAVSRPITW